jgi:hypothetical protein
MLLRNRHLQVIRRGADSNRCKRLPRIQRRIGWFLMGYPYDLPLWKHIYRCGARIHNGGAR